jgi:hypothetical protein
VVSRSEDQDAEAPKAARKGRPWVQLQPVRRDESDDSSEITVHIRVSYKTLVFAFVSFDVIRRLIDVVPGLS